ncbi:TetR family transcriptional regulator [Tistrella mobilis]|uniref:TetR/AcrR family transcriptional regulator n=1 Tax=Tistrella mobilis TaxID=171437 RepID=UPI003557E5ED
MADGALTPEQILDTAEDVLRRFGLQKTTVVDVARALGVSHGSIYRHFPSKTALREAVASRWLARVSEPLGEIAAETGPALPRLRRWLEQLIRIKRGKVLDDPELFAVYHALADEADAVVQEHVGKLVDQISRMLSDGMVTGEVRFSDPRAMAWAVLRTTMVFHHPAHVGHWSLPEADVDRAFDDIFDLITRGLTPAEA